MKRIPSIVSTRTTTSRSSSSRRRRRSRSRSKMKNGDHNFRWYSFSSNSSNITPPLCTFTIISYSWYILLLAQVLYSFRLNTYYCTSTASASGLMMMNTTALVSSSMVVSAFQRPLSSSWVIIQPTVASSSTTMIHNKKWHNKIFYNTYYSDSNEKYLHSNRSKKRQLLLSLHLRSSNKDIDKHTNDGWNNLDSSSRDTDTNTFLIETHTRDNMKQNNMKKENKRYYKNSKTKLSFHELNTTLVSQLQTILTLQKWQQEQQQHQQEPVMFIHNSTVTTTHNNTAVAGTSTDEHASYSDSKSMIPSTSEQLEQHILNLIWSSQNIHQIDSIRSMFTSFCKQLLLVPCNTNNNDKNNSNNSNNNNSRSSAEGYDNHSYYEENMQQIYHDLQYVGPNIASALLRRMVDLQPPLSSTVKNDYDKHSLTSNEKQMDIELAAMYIPVLLQIISKEIMEATNVVPKAYNQKVDIPVVTPIASTSLFTPYQQWISNLDNIIHNYNQMVSLPFHEDNIRQEQQHQQKRKEKKIPSKSEFTHFSLVNVLHSLSVLSRRTNSYCKLQPNFQEVVEEQDHDATTRNPKSPSKSVLSNDNNQSILKSTMDDINTFQLVESISSLLNCQKVHQLTPKRSLEILSSLATFVQSQSYDHDKRFSNYHITRDDKQYHLIYNVSNRLRKGDSIGILNGRDLSLGLWSLSVLKTCHYGMIKSFMRKLRKQNIRQDMQNNDLCKAIWSIGHLMIHLKEQQNEQQNYKNGGIFKDIGNFHEDDADDNENMNAEYRHKEAKDWKNNIMENNGSLETMICAEDIPNILNECETCCYTLLIELVRDQNGQSQTHKKTLHKSRTRNLKAMQLADILSTCSKFELKNNPDMLSKLVSDCEFIHNFNEECSATDIARILRSMQHLKIIDTAIVSKLIERYFNLLVDKNSGAAIPKTLTSVLRSIVLILPDNGKSELEFTQRVMGLFTNERYLQICNENQISNFMFILAKLEYHDKVAIRALCNRMSDLDIVSTCTARSASRFLWSMSYLVSTTEDLCCGELLFKMFQSLGGTLLSTGISAIDASSAMWAIAKSSYALDKGIFDHLAESLAEDEVLEQASVKQVCQALWACGKMIHFEDPLRDKMEYGEVKPPPYQKFAIKYATFLVSCMNQMSPKDVAQSIWALGKLKITDSKILFSLAIKASQLASAKELNSQELANTIWGLSKADFNDELVMSILIKEMQDDGIVNLSTPQEAANVMYALGKMLIRDEELFACMTKVVMNNLDEANTQTMANVLWAHDRVNLTPPQQLFDSWAKEKLGLYIDDKRKQL